MRPCRPRSSRGLGQRLLPRGNPALSASARNADGPCGAQDALLEKLLLRQTQLGGFPPQLFAVLDGHPERHRNLTGRRAQFSVRVGHERTMARAIRMEMRFGPDTPGSSPKSSSTSQSLQ